jgi:hypothetical protein
VIEAGLIDYLSNHPLVTSIVAGRVYPQMVPQGTALPAITVQRISSQRPYEYDGPSGLVGARIQVSSNALTYQDAKTSDDYVRQSLAGYVGYLGQFKAQAVIQEDSRDDFSPPIHADATGAHRIMSDYTIWYLEQ